MPASPVTSRRIVIPPGAPLADANSQIRHPADRGAWIWHPAKAPGETAILRFRLTFAVQEPLKTVLHVSGDQRFQLRCGPEILTFGPDRSDLTHWSVHSLEATFLPGEHTLEALVWHLAAPLGREPMTVTPPMAQTSWRGGFLLFADGESGQPLNTGTAPWTVEDLTAAVRLSPQNVPGYHDIGPAFNFDLDPWLATPREAVTPEVIHEPVAVNPHGIRHTGWALQPAELPEQRHEPWTGGAIRAVREGWSDGPWLAAHTLPGAIAEWQSLLQGHPLVIPPHTERELLWDFQTYHCGYPRFTTENGSPSTVIEWTWAEALYHEATASAVNGLSHKGHRGEIEGKVFVGLTDRWRIGSASVSNLPALWWRAGRYIRLRIKTADAPLTLQSVSLNLTGYPLDLASHWESSDPRWNRLMPLFQHALRSAAHETWTDTPYYEQMCYVGDNVICALANYAWFGDARLSRRSIQLFEWSRLGSGFIAERYPSRLPQESSTFSLLWPTMVRDYAWWRNDAPFIRSMLPGLRSVLAETEGLAQGGLLREVPGWPFIDWCPEWLEGCGPGVREGDSSIVNLQWILALQAAAQIETALGDPSLGERNRRLAREIFTRIEARYWDPARQLFRDTLLAEAWSEHAQIFALLSGLLDPAKTNGCLAALERDPADNAFPMARTTIYGSFYLFQALRMHRREAAFHRRIAPWFDLPERGFTSTPEAPEPSRSDAHAWGAHPAWHAIASIAGVRPAAPGFAEVEIAPLPGSLSWIKTAVVHPRGTVQVDLHFENGNITGTVCLPSETTGNLLWNNTRHPLAPGLNPIQSI